MRRKHPELAVALSSIDAQLTRKRYGRASLEVLGRQLEIWAYKATKRRYNSHPVKLYNRYVYKIDGVIVSHEAVGALFKQEKGE